MTKEEYEDYLFEHYTDEDDEDEEEVEEDEEKRKKNIHTLILMLK